MKSKWPCPMVGNRRGQALIESLVALPVIILIIGALFLLCYRAVIFFYADYSLHESLICTEDESVASCRENLRDDLAKISILQTSQTVRITRDSAQAQGSVELKFALAR